MSQNVSETNVFVACAASPIRTHNAIVRWHTLSYAESYNTRLAMTLFDGPNTLNERQVQASQPVAQRSPAIVASAYEAGGARLPAAVLCSGCVHNIMASYYYTTVYVTRSAYQGTTKT